MRIHLGHHFYGAGNLGDDFMLAGFLSAIRSLAPAASFTCSVPFPLEPLRQRFPAIEWLPYDHAARTNAIARCDVWLGLGGSPFQSAQSRWFIDHLSADAALCAHAAKPMFLLGIGVQTTAELNDSEVVRLCSSAAGIWTRDAASADRLRSALAQHNAPLLPPISAAADAAHLFFRETAPPPAQPRRVTLVANFDYGGWPGQNACLRAVEQLQATEHVWLAQESRELPGAERALHAALPSHQRTRWSLVSPEEPDGPLADTLARWPSGEWLITSRYHAALAGAWSGSKIVIIATNEKLRAAADQLQVPVISPDADEPTVARALAAAQPTRPPRSLAEQAHAACAEFVRSAVAPAR